MKIRNMEMAIALLAHLGVALGLGWFAFHLYSSAAAARAEARLGPRIQRCLSQGDEAALAQGVELCNALLAAAPGCTEARLYLGALLFKLGKHAEALNVFERIGAGPRIEKKLAAMGWVGAGAVAFELHAKKGASEKVLKMSEQAFQAALALHGSCAEAHVGLALLSLWGPSETRPTRGSAAFSSILEKGLTPGLGASQAFYNGMGVAWTREEKTADAEKAFGAALAINPQDKTPQANLRRAALADFARPRLSLEAREALIQSYRSRTKIFGKEEASAINALAVGLWWTRRERKAEDYVGKVFPDAIGLLKTALARFKNDPQAYRNLAGLYEDRLFGDPRILKDDLGLWGSLRSTLREKGCISSSALASWIEGGEAPPTESEIKVMNEIYALAREEAGILSALLLNVGTLTADEKWELERHRFTCFETMTAAATKPAMRAPALAEMGRSVAHLLELGPKRWEAWKAKARLLQHGGDYKKMVDALRTAVKAGDTSEEARLALDLAAKKTSLYDLRPSQNRWFGTWPVIRATAHPHGLPGALEVSLLFDGKRLPAHQAGTQILMVAGPELLTDGMHEIEARAVDVMGNACHATFSLILDKRPPDLSVEPKQFVSGPRPTWTVTLSDAGVGLDLNSISVVLKSISPSATPLHEQLIEAGRHRLAQPRFDVKEGDALTTGTFHLTVERDLRPGVYGLRFTYSDKIGNQKVENLNFILKEGE